MTINQRIFDTLKAQGKSQSDMARALNVRIATVSEWKRERTTPSAATVGQIAAYLSVSTDYIITGAEFAPAPTVQQGVFGDHNKNNAVTIGRDGAGELSEFESELLRIYNALDTESKAALIMRAYELSRKSATGV